MRLQRNHSRTKLYYLRQVVKQPLAPLGTYLTSWRRASLQACTHFFIFYFKESLIAFILFRIWRWPAAPDMPGGLSLLHGPVPALPAIYKNIHPSHDKLRYCLTPLLVLPQQLTDRRYNTRVQMHKY